MHLVLIINRNIIHHWLYALLNNLGRNIASIDSLVIVILFHYLLPVQFVLSINTLASMWFLFLLPWRDLIVIAHYEVLLHRSLSWLLLL
jgi:hypothetical protein